MEFAMKTQRETVPRKQQQRTDTLKRKFLKTKTFINARWFWQKLSLSSWTMMMMVVGDYDICARSKAVKVG